MRSRYHRLAEAPGSELAILRRELQKQRRHKPIRQLFRDMPDLLGQLHHSLRRPIDTVLCTHLHFDHAGGNTYREPNGAVASTTRHTTSTPDSASPTLSMAVIRRASSSRLVTRRA